MKTGLINRLSAHCNTSDILRDWRQIAREAVMTPMAMGRTILRSFLQVPTRQIQEACFALPLCSELARTFASVSRLSVGNIIALIGLTL